jgi:hypothetical protein
MSEDRGDHPRRSGRPPLIAGTTLERVSARVPVPVYDQLASIAIRRGVTLGEIVREAAQDFVHKTSHRRP